MSEMKKLGIIGIGNWGKNLVRELSKIHCIKKCSSNGNLKNIRWLKKNYPSIQYVSDSKEIFADKEINAIIIATPINTHYKLVKKALLSKKHVFVEKPISTNLSEAEELIEIAKKNNLLLFVGHIFIFNEIFKKLIQDNEFRSMRNKYISIILKDSNNLIKIYDEILEIIPADSKIHELKGIVLSNIRLQSTLGSQATENSPIMYDILTTNKLSMLEFYKASEINPASVIALNGLGIGFGNFGEYHEAKKYFTRALEIEPDNFVTKNYLDYIEKTIKKYPTNQTEKPPFLLKLEKNEIPYWIKTNAGWWASDKISDNDFISGIQYLVKNKIIRLD